MTTPPLCPVTGEPAVRLVQWVSARFLADLWRIELRIDVRPSFRGVRRFGLWESPTGLYFFDPPVEGDRDFYEQFYSVLKTAEPRALPRLMHGLLRLVQPLDEGTARPEFLMAATHIRDDERVLDVGCGPDAGFRLVVPHSRYLGLDPHFGDRPGVDWGSAESLGDHLRHRTGAYDVVTAFQVLEHVAAPLDLLADMTRAARPGGKVIVGVPHHPSAHSRLPNYLVNAVPHHLTWWTERALREIAARVGLRDVTVEAAPWGRIDSLIYWMERCSPVTCRDIHYRHSWIWHGSAFLGFLGGVLLRGIMPSPHRAGDEGASLVLVGTTPDRESRDRPLFKGREGA